MFRGAQDIFLLQQDDEQLFCINKDACKSYLKRLFSVLLSGRTQRRSPISMLDCTLLHSIFRMAALPIYQDPLCGFAYPVAEWRVEAPEKKKAYHVAHKEDWKQRRRVWRAKY